MSRKILSYSHLSFFVPDFCKLNTWGLEQPLLHENNIIYKNETESVVLHTFNG